MSNKNEIKNTTVTFDGLLESTNNATKNNVRLDIPLVNEEYHKSSEFSQNYYNKFGLFSNDENLLKREYLSWHKQLGLAIYDPIRKQITNPNYSKIMQFLKTHPSLTNKDQRTLLLVRSDVNDRYIRYLVLTYTVWAGLVTVLIRRYKNTNETFRTAVLNNKFRIISAAFISFFAFDVLFKTTFKNQSIINVLEKRQLKARYFDSYL